jgi:hypothetical protein
LRFSAAELAHRIAGHGGDVALAARRIRHHTLIGALRTIGDAFVGTGRSRAYDVHGLHVAAVLHQLAENGATAGTLKKAGDLMAMFAPDQPRGPEWASARRLWEEATAGRGPVYLVCSAAGPTVLLSPEDLVKFKLASPDFVTVGNITKVFDTLRGYETTAKLLRGEDWPEGLPTE